MVPQKKNSKGFDPGVKEGHFYVDPHLNFFYFCEKIEGDTIYWILVESYQHGHLIQVRFTQSTENVRHYVEVKDKEVLNRLEQMLNNLKEKGKESEFLKLIKEIDEGFKKQNIPIFQRPLCAIREICIRQKISLNVVPYGPAVPGLYTGDSLVAHVHEWYKKRYGDRLKIDFSPGSSAILIKGDPWKIKLPLLFGRAKFVFDPDLEKFKEEPKTKINEPIIANPLNCIEKFTTEIAKSLSKQEMQELAQFFMLAFEILKSLVEIKRKPYIPEAKADLDSAVNNIFSSPPHYGQSKWASLQFTEKLFKCFLELKNVSFPKKHDLKKLSYLASKNGLPAISPSVIQDIQCPAGVRYGEIAVTLNEAILAHHSSLKVCSVLIPAIKAI